jgi:hypothetical protein
MSLSDYQMARVIEAAALLPVTSRDKFLGSLAGRLADLHRPSDADVMAAITLILGDSYGIAFGTAHFISLRSNRSDQTTENYDATTHR